MATNEILPFATNDTGTNLLTQSEYSADSQREIGHQPGIARSKLTNKTMRQTSLLSSGLAQFISQNQNNDITDNLTTQQVADFLVLAIQELINIPEFVSPGSIIYVARAVAPTGYLKANGAAVSRTTFGDLFSAIGTTFGNGDGSTTFNLPDLRGEFLRGLDDGRGVDSGRGLGTSQNMSIQSHNHSISLANADDFNFGPLITSSDTSSFPIAPTSTGDFGGAETRPRNVAMLACIRF